MALPSSEHHDTGQGRAALVFLVAACVVGLLVIAGLALTGVSADAMLRAESIRRVFDHVVHRERVAVGPVLLAVAVGVTLVAPLAALMSVAFLGKQRRPKYIALAIGVVVITGGGAVLAFV